MFSHLISDSYLIAFKQSFQQSIFIITFYKNNIVFFMQVCIFAENSQDLRKVRLEENCFAVQVI